MWVIVLCSFSFEYRDHFKANALLSMPLPKVCQMPAVGTYVELEKVTHVLHLSQKLFADLTKTYDDIMELFERAFHPFTVRSPSPL